MPKSQVLKPGYKTQAAQIKLFIKRILIILAYNALEL